MQLGIGTAPGKVILFGEHAVVYGRPALAAPVTQVCATATVAAGRSRDGPDDRCAGPRRTCALAEAAIRWPKRPVWPCEHLGSAEPDWTRRPAVDHPDREWTGQRRSRVSSALARAWRLPPAASWSRRMCPRIAFEVERLHHGTPSGVDNTVIAYGQPVYFVRGQPPQPFAIGRPFLLAIGDTGIASPTRIAVGDVRAGWQAEPARYEALFDEIGRIVAAAREAIVGG